MDKVDGPYYFFKLIRRIRNAVPQWLPMPGVEGREINIVPVDFVVKAMDHIAHTEGLDGRAFHLTDPNPRTAGEVIDIFARAAHAPQSSVRVPPVAIETLEPLIKAGLTATPLVGRRPRSGARRLRDPARGPRLRELPDPLRLAPDPGRARGDRNQRAAAGGLRGQALGLLGAPPRPRPVPRQDADGRRARAPRPGRRPRPDHRAAGPGRADASRPPRGGQPLARGRGPRPRDHGHRRFLGDR